MGAPQEEVSAPLPHRRIEPRHRPEILEPDGPLPPLPTMKLESTLNTRPGMGYIAPLLDVVMLLLIFFLLSSQFIQRSGFAVDLPFSRSTLEALAEADVITIPTGTVEMVLVNERRVPVGELGSHLEVRAKIGRQIVIRADKSTPHGRVVNIVNIANDAGFRDIGIITSPEAD